MTIFPQPTNRNFLGDANWRFAINKLPNTTYFGQGINLPSIALPAAVEPTPFVEIPWPGDHIKYDDLVIKFAVDEDLSNWLELHNWMTGLGFPDDYEQYKKLKETKDGSQSKDFGGLFSAASLLITTNKRNAEIAFNFEGLWPTALSGLEFTSTNSDFQYVTATAIFRYTLYRYSKNV